MTGQYGATPDEWTTFDVLLGLTDDLLPVVSNPDAVISPPIYDAKGKQTGGSTLKDKGKVPSRYNARREVVGIPDWTSFIATGPNVAKWSREPDYGICLQTRHIRALDIDIEQSAPVLNHLWESGLRFPIRQRANSGKCLLAFRLGGEMPKRVLKTENGMIEFLANGQQFIAAGTHPSGARYDWEGLDQFPELTPEEFEELWSSLAERFGIEASHTGRLRNKPTDEKEYPHDEILDYLEANHHVLGYGREGQVFLKCPFEAEHTTQSGDTSMAYFRAGTRGYSQGHFKCLHAHCVARSTDSFADAFGIRISQFERLGGAAPEDDPAALSGGVADTVPGSKTVAGTLAAPWPAFKRKNSGEIVPNIGNLHQALRRSDVCAVCIAYDSFRDEVVLTSEKNHALQWRPLSDNDYTVIQLHLERAIGFEPIAVDLLRRTVQAVAYENTFDSAILWLEGLTWDGVPRVDRFMARYLGAEETGYARAVSRYTWTALAGRALVPGIKADMVPIWESPQGRIKSTTIEALVPEAEYFLEVGLDEKETDLARKMRGKLVGEISELKGLETKDPQSLNAFITRRYEEWVPKYQEKSRKLPRRLVFIATTNKKEILGDSTGHRRWLPIPINRADIKAITRDRDQLWAEAREMFREEGICFQEAEALAPSVHRDYLILDVWGDVIRTWLETPTDMDGRNPLTKGYITIGETLNDALHIEPKSLRGPEGKRVAKILRELGCERKKIRIGKDTQWVWTPPAEDLI